MGRIIVNGDVLYIVSQVEKPMHMAVVPTFTALRNIDVVLPEGVSATAGTARIDYYVSIAVKKYVTSIVDESAADIGAIDHAHHNPVEGLDDGPSKLSADTPLIQRELEVLSCLDAQLRVEFPILFGLKGSFADPVLPALTLGMPQGATLNLSFEQLVASDPLSDTSELRAYLEQKVRDDADNLLKPLRDGQLTPTVRKPLIPLAPYTTTSINEQLGSLVTFRQAGSTAPDEPLAYRGKNGWVYWNWEWIDEFDEWFPS